jgi:purine-cytosine permease-like protein
MSFDSWAGVAIVILLAALVAVHRGAPERTPEQRDADRQFTRVMLQYFALLGSAVGLASLLITVFGWEGSVAFITSGGIMLIVATLSRIGAFWDDPRAIGLRAVIGDRGATALYLIVGIGCLVWSVQHVVAVARFTEDCRHRLAGATTITQRLSVYRHALPGSATQPLTCGHLVEAGKL